MNKLNVKHIVLLIAFVVMATMEMFAAKAVPGAMQVTLVDGRTVTVSLRGDEHLHFLISSDNEIIIREGDTYRVATEEERENIFNSAAKLDEQILANQAKAIDALQANTGEGISGEKLFPHMGTPKVLVLMAEFADVSFTFSKHEVDSLLNSSAVLTKTSKSAKSYSTGEEVVMSKLSAMRSYSSVAQYFNDCSDGLFKPQFDVYGPYTLSKNMSVYGSGANDRMDLFIPQVCALANAEVDFSEYDQDGDGYVDLVYVIYAGYSANWTQNGSDCIWPKSGPSTGPSTTYGVYDGKTVSRYGVNGELLAYPMSSGTKYLNGIGVFCHEFSHTMGLPDFYPASTYNSNVIFADWSTADYDNQSLEEWDLMDGGENNTNGCWPPMYSAFERELMGWIKLDTLDTPSDVTLTPLLHGGKAYRILNDNDPTGNEYWIVEAVSTDEKSEKWQQYLPGKGMLITHVNYNPNTFNIKYNNVNATKGKPGITIIPADGYLPSSYRVGCEESDPDYMPTTDFYIQESGDPYPGSQGITEFNNYKAYTGTVDKPITDIVQNDDFTVSFKFMGGTPPLMGDVNGDGYITMADANAVVNYFLADDATKAQMIEGGFNTEAANVNGDEGITMADANAIVNIFLGQN
ncbi:MAG: M6 family metalloprotease domain-containing protein [Prevotella sp.]|nr:M6 family metalloprotease domain-containing protein [Prevotella sp.]